jgi:hypothetical protein
MNYSAASLTTWTFTDSASPTTHFAEPAGNAPIGSTVDDSGVPHTHRAYYTFDISAFRGQAIHLANLWSNESQVADCGTAAQVEVWRTGPVTDKSTWNKPPKELELVASHAVGKGGIGGCPGAYLGNDTIPFVAAALARHDKTITFEVRVAATVESDPAAARSVQPLHLSMWTNHVPTVSDLGLSLPDRPCGTLAKHPTAGGYATRFTATVTDADPVPSPTVTFALWPVDHPDQRVTIGSSGGTAPQVNADLRAYPDGTVLAWSAQPNDRDDTGAWGRTCYLTVDNTAPARPPVIIPRKYAEAQYPGTGGPGVAGAFLLDAQGDRDVVGFQYRDQQGSSYYSEAKPHHPGGRARISMTPNKWGPHRLEARSFDAAGNYGPWQTYDFYVRDTAPSFDVAVAGVGLPSTITLYSRAAEVTSFGYSVGDGPEAIVPAVGGQGTGTIVFATKGTTTVVSRSYAGQKMIGSDSKQISVGDTPRVTSAQFLGTAEPVLGDQGTFTFTPSTAGVVAYLYEFGHVDGDGGGDQKRIEANADGTATLPWTADMAGDIYLTVYSVTADGTKSSMAYHQFSVIDTHPSVVSYAGGCCPNTDGVGHPVTVSLSSELPGVTGFVYSYDGGAEQTVTGDTWADITVTPTHVGDSTFTARAILADGTRSAPTTITITITNAPLLGVAGPYGSYAVVGRPATVAATPATADVVSYLYYWGDDSSSPQTVDAAADGSASITWTPASAAFAMVNVIAVGRDGTESDVRQLYVETADPIVDYFGTWNDWSPTGGVGVPGWLSFADVSGTTMLDATVKYLWHVNDGPVQETPRTPDAYTTDVVYTPDRAGENILYVQREFTDGALSPVSQFTLLVGTATDPADSPGGTS